MHEIMKIPEIYNDVLELMWINPDSFITFPCCTHIICNDRTLHFEVLERCIDLCFVSHTVLSFIFGQGMGDKNVSTV